MLFSRVFSKFSSIEIALKFCAKRVTTHCTRIMDFPESKKIFVWKDEKKQVVQIQLHFRDYSGVLRQVVMRRPYFDSFDVTRRRMENKLSDLGAPKVKRRKKNEHLEAVKLETFNESCRITPCGVSVTEKTTNMDVFYGCDSLSIGGESYCLLRDIPHVTKMILSLTPIVGMPIIPSYDMQYGGDSSGLKFRWFVTTVDGEELKQTVSRNIESGELELQGWKFAGCGETFRPLAEHTGRRLSVTVDSGEDLLVRVAVSNSLVMGIGEDLIFEGRQREFCATALEGSSCRLVSYNILADLYLNLKQDQEKLFFPYCPLQYQESSYRYPLVLREIIDYNADLLFLQEVDQRMQSRFLAKTLRANGFGLRFNSKANEVNEGLIFAFRESKFRLVPFEESRAEQEEKDVVAEESETSKDTPQKKTILESPSVRVSHLLDTNRFPKNADVAECLARKPKLLQYFQTRPTILQLVHLECLFDGGQTHLLAANTHLLFDPAFEKMKLFQTLLILRYIDAIKAKLTDELVDKGAQLITLFAGDFNSTPETSTVQLLTGNETSVTETAEDAITLGHYSYRSLAGFPDCTNYTGGFAGCLDYIWASSSGSAAAVPRVRRVVPMPLHQLVTKYGALPSKIAPSDHLAIVCDVDFTTTADDYDGEQQ